MEIKITKESVKKLFTDNPEWFRELRLKAFDSFKSKEMPSFKYGLHLKLNLGSFNFENFDVDDSKTNMEVENSEGVIVETFEQVFSHNPGLIKDHFMQLVKFEEDIFSSFHAAFLTHGVRIYVPENVKTEKPLILKQRALGNFQADHLLIIAEKNSRLDLIRTLSSEIGGYRSGIVEIYVKEGAEVNFGNIQALNQNTYNFSVKRAVVDGKGKINWFICTIGSKHARLDVSSTLKGEGAKTNNWALYFGNKNQLFDFSSSTVHSAPNTSSDILTRGVLNDSARAVFRGLIKMQENSAGSDGYQKGDTLLLSENSESDVIPNLEIYNNDVKCSHGASISQIDKEKLFYMMTRGIPEKIARNKIVEGFFEPMIGKIGIAEIQEGVRTNLKRKC